MDLKMFDNFQKECSKNLAGSVDGILKAAKGQKTCAIGFMTTDDFYGFYLSWYYGNSIENYFDWNQGSEPEYLYQPLVEIVESCEDIDFCSKSEKKWEFALSLLFVLNEAIQKIPDIIYQKNNFRREDVLFFATMADGDYIEEMLEASIKMFNLPETIEAFGVKNDLP